MFSGTVRGPDHRPVTGLSGRLDQLDDLFAGIVADFHKVMQGVFDSGSTAGGTKWDPSSRDWISAKARLGRGRQAGVFTGLLERSLTGRTARSSVVRMGQDSLEVGTSAPHAPLFVDGRGGQPGRPLADADWLFDRWSERLVDHFTDDTPFDGVVR